MKMQIAAMVLVCLMAGVADAADWLQFRGTDGAGYATEQNLPTTFSDEENVAWKAPLPGRGPSSPIVVGDQVLVTCSSGAVGDRLHLISIDVETGERRWERQLWAMGHAVTNPFGAVACNTPASDGKNVYAFYSSNDLACFDLEGNLRWIRALAVENPAMRNDVGMASSPLVVGNVVVVQCENQGTSLVAGLDANTGETLWQLDREKDAIWSSPTVLRGATPAKDLLMLHGRDHLTGHDPASGELLWSYPAECNTTATVTTDGQNIYLPGNGIHALRYDGETGQAKPLWYERLLRGGKASPVACDGKVYVVKSPAIFACADAHSGKILWQVRLKGQVWATPVVAGGHAYIVNHDGVVHAVELGKKGNLVGTSQLDGPILASPAVSGGAIYFRSDSNLWKVALAK